MGLSTIQSVYAHTGWAYWVASDQISPSSFGISQADDRSLPKAAWDGLTTYWPDLRWTIWIEKYCDICVKKIK
ncbi:MAG: hypothetical protein WB988_25935 [Candidatus Nitrosopolaris sp.]